MDKKVEFRSLDNLSIDEIVKSFKRSFIDYFVSFQEATTQYFEERWKISNINYKASVGTFDSETNELVGLVLWSIDEQDGENVAFNIGTGVFKEYRGAQLSKRMIDYSIPILKAEPYNITKLGLEVITINTAAIKSYERSGFKIVRELHYFKGELPNKKIDDAESTVTTYNNNLSTTAETLKIVKGTDIEFDKVLPLPKFQVSWENRLKVLKNNQLNMQLWSLVDDDNAYNGKNYLFITKSGLIGYRNFESVEKGIELVSHLVSEHSKIAASNIDSRDEISLAVFRHFKLDDSIKQYEMSRPIDL